MEFRGQPSREQPPQVLLNLDPRRTGRAPSGERTNTFAMAALAVGRALTYRFATTFNSILASGFTTASPMILAAAC